MKWGRMDKLSEIEMDDQIVRAFEAGFDLGWKAGFKDGEQSARSLLIRDLQSKDKEKGDGAS